MSGSINTVEGGAGFSTLGPMGGIPSTQLMSILAAEDILPGSEPGYQLCKTIYLYHPLGAKIVETPVKLAMSQARDITVPGGPETKLVAAFRREWSSIGGRDVNGSDVSADNIILNLVTTAKIYGIASLVMGDRNKPNGNDQPVDFETLGAADIYFNMLDPLNTAGSLVLDQDPASPDFQKARSVRLGEMAFHPSRTVIIMNERPVYIAYTPSAFGYVGRSAYQRALFPLKTFVQTMITDQYVTLKVGLLIAKMKSPGSVTTNRIMNFFGWKRGNLQAGVTGNVLSIGIEEGIESINFQNLEGPAMMARNNALKNVAMSAGMPSKLLEEEEMIGGMAEGTEDAKRIAAFVDTVRDEMTPAYRFFDRVVMRRAWDENFYKTIQAEFPEQYGDVPYKTAFYQWMNSFEAKWPNLLEEPDSEKMKTEEIRFKSVVALVETAAPLMDPVNKANTLQWMVDEVNARRDLFSAPLEFDFDEMASYVPPQPAAGEGAKEPQPKPFGANT
jgi:hypothetical protein